MCTASSAAATWGELRSPSLYTATVAMPCSRQVRNTRMAISPRLATKIFEKGGVTARQGSPAGGAGAMADAIGLESCASFTRFVLEKAT